MSMREYNRFIDEILPGIRETNVFNKENNISLITILTLNRLQKLFRYDGLPATIPAEYMEMYIQMNGSCIVADVNGSLYALVGSLSGEPDAYYLPKEYTVANPYLKLFKTYIRGEDCVFIKNDPYLLGLYPIVYKYAQQIAETELSMNISVINARIMSLITASTDKELEAANKFIEDIVDGKLSAIAQQPFFDGIKAQPYANSAQSNAITDLIEMKQYLKAGMFNDLGLNANYNMKRESLNSNESQLNDDMLTPFIDLMLEQRKKGVEAVNNLFGTDISVEFDSAWKENKIEHALELTQMLDTITGGDNAIKEDNGQDPELTEVGNDETSLDKQDDQEVTGETEEIKEEIAEELQDLISEDINKEVTNNVNENED